MNLERSFIAPTPSSFRSGGISTGASVSRRLVLDLLRAPSLRLLALFWITAFCWTLSVGSPLQAAVVSEESGESNWPGFRGSDATGIAVDANPATDWTGKIAWKTAIEGFGQSSPVIWGDHVFLTTALEGEVIEGAEPPEHTFGGRDFKHPQAVAGNKHHTLKVISIHRETGEIRWSKTAYEGRVYDDRHQKSSYASPTAVTDGKYVYAYFGSEGVYAFDFDGKLAWKNDIGDIKAVGLGVASSPVLFQDLLIIQADEDSGDQSFIVALDTASGEQRWKTERPVQISWTTPVIVEREEGRTELLSSGNEWIISYDPLTGSEIWRIKGLENNAIHVPLVHQDLAVFSSGYPEKMTFAVKLGQEGDLTDTEAVAWRYTKGTAYVPSNLLIDGLLYLTNDGGTLTCLDATTGEVVYEGGRLPMRGRLTASLVGTADTILMINEDGDGAFIKTGRTHEVLATVSVDEPVQATPALAGDWIYVRGKQHLFAIGPNNID